MGKVIQDAVNLRQNPRPLEAANIYSLARHVGALHVIDESRQSPMCLA